MIVLNLDSLIAVAPFPLLCSETPDKRQVVAVCGFGGFEAK